MFEDQLQDQRNENAQLFSEIIKQKKDLDQVRNWKQNYEDLKKAWKAVNTEVNNQRKKVREMTTLLEQARKENCYLTQ